MPHFSPCGQQLTSAPHVTSAIAVSQRLAPPTTRPLRQIGWARGAGRAPRRAVQERITRPRVFLVFLRTFACELPTSCSGSFALKRVIVVPNQVSVLRCVRRTTMALETVWDPSLNVFASIARPRLHDPSQIECASLFLWPKPSSQHHGYFTVGIYMCGVEWTAFFVASWDARTPGMRA